eukprot:954312-Alexandrium_andersonii.AAC.1
MGVSLRRLHSKWWNCIAHPGLRGSSRTVNEDGVAYDLRQARDRQRSRERLRAERPWLVIGSPPCT